MALYAAEGVDAVKQRQPAAEIVQELAREAERLLARRGPAIPVSTAVC
jgi:hypothetical protein